MNQIGIANEHFREVSEWIAQSTSKEFFGLTVRACNEEFKKSVGCSADTLLPFLLVHRILLIEKRIIFSAHEICAKLLGRSFLLESVG